jgi:site-specific DNA recombinase
VTPRTTPVRAALYARVSSDRQAEEGTIASQVEALRHRAVADGLVVADELSFRDEGYSGATLVRPALERLRDQAAAGALDRLYVLDPDRLARNYAYQFLLVQELQGCGVEVVFLNRALGASAEDNLLLQVQGIIAEYERTKIKERCRRGKLHSARHGQVAALGKAPYGYRYVTRQEGNGEARWDVVLEEARVVRQIFTWVGQERLSLSAVCRRLREQGVPAPRGGACWRPACLTRLLRNPAYQGEAAFGKWRRGRRGGRPAGGRRCPAGRTPPCRPTRPAG